MKDIIVDAFGTQAYAIRNLSNFVDGSGDYITSIPKDNLKFSFKDSSDTGSFEGLVVTRLEDLELESIYFKNTNTGEEWVPDIQGIGTLFSCPSWVKVYAHFITPPNVMIQDPEFDFHLQNVTLYDENGIPQDSLLIKDTTAKFKYTFSCSVFTKTSDFIYLTCDNVITAIELEFDNKDEETGVPFVYSGSNVFRNDTKVTVTYSTGTEQSIALDNIPSNFTFEIRNSNTEVITEWPEVQNDFHAYVTCDYTGIDGSLEPRHYISYEVTVNVIKDKVKSFEVIGQESISLSFYGYDPSIVINLLSVERFSGKSTHIDYPSGITFDPIEPQYDLEDKGLLSNEIITKVYYNDPNEVKETLYADSKPFMAHAEITDIIITNASDIPEQYSGTTLDISNIQLKVTYNIKETKNGETYKTKECLLSDTCELSDSHGYIENGKWTNPSEDLSIKTLEFKYTDSATGEEYPIDVDFILHRNVVTKIEYKGDSKVRVHSGSSFSENKYKFPLDVTFADGSKIENVLPESMEKNGEVQTVFETFTDGENDNSLQILEKKVSFDIVYGEKKFSFTEESDEEPKVYIERAAQELVPYKIDNSTYSFYDDNQQMNTEVKINHLHYIIITYNDGSKYRLTLVDNNYKISQLTAKNISLFTTTWGFQQTQRNYIRFINAMFDETYKFSTYIDGILGVEVASGRILYQGDPISGDLDKLIFRLKVRDFDGKMVSRKYKATDIDGLTVRLTSDSSATTWPVDSSNINRKYITSSVTAIIYSEEYGEKEKTFYLSYYRSPEKLELALNSQDEYSTTLILDSAIIGESIGIADFGQKQKVTFKGGSFIESEDIDKDLLRPVEFRSATEIDPSVQISRWPLSGEFALIYDEFEDLTHAKWAKVCCNQSNLKHNPSKITATLINNMIVAGQNIEPSHFDVKVYGLLNELIGTAESSNITVSPNITKTTDTVVSVIVSYSTIDAYNNPISLKSQVRVPLLPKVCNLSYEVLDSSNGLSLTSTAQIATKYSYTPKTTEQIIDTKIYIPVIVDGSSIYSYSSLTAVKVTDNSVIEGISYDPVFEKLTLPPEVDFDIKITFKYVTDYDSDEYGHLYSVSSEGVLLGVYQTEGAQSTYRLPMSVSTIPYSKNAFSGNNSVVKLIIPSTLTRIREQAFVNCTNLEEIKFESRRRGDGNSNTDIYIGSKAFSGCKSLTVLDFLECGDIRNGYIFGVKDNSDSEIVRDTWENCKLRVIRIDQRNFTKYLRCHYIDNSIGHPQYWITGRCGGGFIMQFEPMVPAWWELRETWMASVRQPGTGTGKPSNADTAYYVSSNFIYGITHDYAYNQEFMAYEHDSSHYEQIKNVLSLVGGGYDFRDKCAGMIRSDRNSNTFLICLGLGYLSEWEYDTFIASDGHGGENYSFTSNGRDGSGSTGLEFVSVETEAYGHHFGNWNMSDYVNGCIYPNLKLSSSGMLHHDFTKEEIEDVLTFGKDQATREQYNASLGGTYLDLMIPLYTKIDED